MGSVSKHQSRDKDRISALPDALLSHMLSFLPTKYAVRTSILSTRWKNIWTTVQSVDCDGDFSDSAGFFGLVLIKHNVVELDLCVKSDVGKVFKLPRSLLMCNTLAVLRLISNCITYSSPTSECFPSLNFYHVTLHESDNDSIIQLTKCLSYCPVLEDLTIDGNNLRNDNKSYVQVYSISLPKPKRFRISESFHCFLSECNFVIDAPNLESVYLKQDHGLTCYVENAKFLVKASIINEGRSSYIGPKPYFKLLKGICTVNYLFLDWASLFKGLVVPSCPNLRPLKLVFRDDPYWKVLDAFLQGSSNLEDIVLEDRTKCDEDDSVHNPIDLYKPPYCVRSLLKTISIRGFMG